MTSQPSEVKTDKFAHLHVHTQFSMLDGLGSVDEYVLKAKEHGQKHLAITDHGTLCGLPEFYNTTRKHGIEPVLGSEFYFVEDAGRAKEEKDNNRYHVVMLAKGLRGYQSLAELSTESNRAFYYKPMIDRTMLESLERPEDFVVLSGCAGSVISQAIIDGDIDKAEAEVMWWRETFPNFYMELQHHDTEFDRNLNRGLVKLAKKYGLPWVITNDPHFVEAEDAKHHEVLLAVQTNADIDDPNRFRFDGEGYHLKTRAEMLKAFRQYGKEVWREGARNTLKIAEECYVRIPDWEARTWHIPKYARVKNSYKELKRLTIQGLRERGMMDEPEYVEQAKHELKVFKETNLADFMLITRECIEWAREQDIPVGPGRGSVCGTLVGFLIGIHKIDPIRYGLRFDRFLNPARPKMPDIDTDFGQARREEMFTHVEEEYGAENTVHVAAFQRMRMKRAFQSIGKAHGISFTDRIEISKMLSDDEEVEDTLPIEVQEAYPELAAQLVRLAGVKSSVSAHPAGVIIADPRDDIRKLVPEMWIASSKRWVGQYDLEAVEDMGLLKQDFLGLRTLDTIQECTKLIEARTGERVDPDSWMPDEEEHDRRIYSMCAKGRTAGVFQMEGPVNQRGCREVRPRSFEDLVSVTSLYRTGPIQAGYPKQFNENRVNGKSSIEYPHPLLKPILEDTWGVILYQEQVMTIAEVLAGFSQERVDDIKEAIKHKKSALMVSLEPEFVKGCSDTHNIPEHISKAIWKDIEGYSGYCLTGDVTIERAFFNEHSDPSSDDTFFHKHIKIEDLYKRWHLDTKNRKFLRKRGLKIRALVDGVIKVGRCIDVVENGVQPVWKITLADGKHITSTAGHRHLTPGGWVEARNLNVGSKLVVDSEVQAEKQTNTIYWDGEGLGRGWYSHRTPERSMAADGYMRPVDHGHSTALRLVTEELPDHCERCGATKEDGTILDRAHLDGDRTNNTRENVQRLCRRCHKAHDRDSVVHNWKRGTLPQAVQIVAIESAGEQQTYDLVMEDEGHNFLANGILTHNSYNRSHAVAYTFVTYQTARLKLLYPMEFISALVRTVPNSKQGKEKRSTYLKEALRRGIKVLPPDINISADKATPDYEANAIRFGLTDIAGVGAAAMKKIEEGRPEGGYTSFEELADVVRNKGTMNALANASALESIGIPGDESETERLLAWTFRDRMAKYRKKYKDRVRLPQRDGQEVILMGELFKATRGSTKTGKPYMTWKIRWSLTESFDVRLWSETMSLWKIPEGSIVIVQGEWESRWLNVSIGDPGRVRLVRRG